MLTMRAAHASRVGKNSKSNARLLHRFLSTPVAAGWLMPILRVVDLAPKRAPGSVAQGFLSILRSVCPIAEPPGSTPAHLLQSDPGALIRSERPITWLGCDRST